MKLGVKMDWKIKIITCITLGRIVLSKWSSNVAEEKSFLSLSSSSACKWNNVQKFPFCKIIELLKIRQVHALVCGRLNSHVNVYSHVCSPNAWLIVNIVTQQLAPTPTFEEGNQLYESSLWSVQKFRMRKKIGNIAKHDSYWSFASDTHQNSMPEQS